MSSMGELMQKLTAREKEKFAAEQDAAARAREADAKVTQASESLMELKRAQEQELKVLKAQYEKHQRDLSYQCRQMVHRAIESRAQAEAIAEASEKRQRSAEKAAENLELKLRDLQAHVAWRTQSAEDALASLERMMDQRISRMSDQDNQRVSAMTDFAKEVEDISRTAVTHNATTLQDQTSRAQIRYDCRARFKELVDMAKERSSYDMGGKEYFELKEELSGLWLTQSGALQGSSSPRMPMTPTYQSVAPRSEMMQMEAQGPSVGGSQDITPGNTLAIMA